MSTSVPIFMQRQVVETLTWLTCLLAWVAAINCVVIISGTAPRTLDPGLGTLSISTSPANTGVSPSLGSGLQAVKIQLQVHTNIWPSHELSHSVSGLQAGWYVRWGLRVDVTLSSHVTAIQVIAAVMPDVCSGVVHEVMDR